MEGWCIIIAIAVGPYLYKQIVKNLINICYSLFYDQKQIKTSFWIIVWSYSAHFKWKMSYLYNPWTMVNQRWASVMFALSSYYDREMT